MPRTRNVYNTEYPYHICGRTNDRLPFPCDLDSAWEIYCDALWFYSRILHTRILAFVMMNNHFHLLMTAPKGNLSEFMKHFMKKTSDDIRFLRGHENHLYGNRYYPTLVDNQRYFETVFKYIHHNPIRAGLCKSVFDYPYSTLNGFLGLERMKIPTFDDFHFFDNLNSNLIWLDQPFQEGQIDAIRNALYRQAFKLERNQNGFLDDTLLL